MLHGDNSYKNTAFALHARNVSWQQEYNKLDRICDMWIADSKKKDGIIAELQAQLAKEKNRADVNECTALGHEAQKNAFLEEHPNSNLKSKTNVIWKTGTYAGQMKSRLRIIFENAFDSHARKIGLSNPEKIRGE